MLFPSLYVIQFLRSLQNFFLLFGSQFTRQYGQLARREHENIATAVCWWCVEKSREKSFHMKNYPRWQWMGSGGGNCSEHKSRVRKFRIILQIFSWTFPHISNSENSFLPIFYQRRSRRMCIFCSHINKLLVNQNIRFEFLLIKLNGIKSVKSVAK